MALTTHSHLPPRLKKEYSYTSTLPLSLLGLFYGQLYAFTFKLKLLYAPLRTARTETHTHTGSLAPIYMTANPGHTRLCNYTSLLRIIQVYSLKNFVRFFVNFVNYNVRGGFQKYLHIFLHTLPFTHDTLNRCPAGSSCSSVHFTPFPMSLISAFSSRNWAVAS